MEKSSADLFPYLLNAPFPTLCVRDSGAILAANQHCHDFDKLIFSAPEEQSWLALVENEDLERAAGIWSSVISSDEHSVRNHTIECRIKLKTTEVVHWYRLFFARSESGQSHSWTITFVSVQEDVVTRARYELLNKELAKSSSDTHLNSQEKLLMQRLIDSVPALVWTADKNGNVLFVSHAPKATTLLPWQNIEKYGWGAGMHCDTTPEIKARWDFEAFKGGPFEFELPLTQQDGSAGWYRINANPVRDEQGAIVKWFGACTCIGVEKSLSVSLQAALKTRSNFVAQVSHELRTPLNGMLPLIELLLRCNLDEDAKTRVLTLRDAGASLLHVINEILDFSKLESGKVEADFSDFDLLELVEGVTQILAPAAASKGVLLLSCLAPDVPLTIKGDAQKLRQVLLNLCGNAVKFTDAGHVQLTVKTIVGEMSKPALLLEVNDTGPGIDDTSMKQLFEPFFQGTGTSHRAQAGTGLGLSISRRLVELMGGTISVESEVLRGSSFRVMLPLSATKSEPTRTVCNLPSLKSTKVNVFTFEPCHSGQWLIADTIKCLDSVVDSTDSVDVALRHTMEPAPNGQSKYQILILDFVRYAEQSRKLLELVDKGGRPAGLTIVSLVADNSDVASEWGNRLQMKMAMPLRRAALKKLFDAFSDTQSKVSHTRDQQTSTLQLAETTEVGRGSWLQQPGQTKRVLVADDNNMNRYVASIVLSDLGFEVDTANDGVEAVQACKVKCYSLIFLDCRMPRLDGFEATRIIKEVHGRRNIAVPIIAVTANAAEGTREECLAQGMDDYISKPIEPQVVQAVVEKWLGRANIKESFRKSSQSWPHLKSDQSQTIINFNKLYGRFSEVQIKEILEVFLDGCASSFELMHMLLKTRDIVRFEQAVASLKISCEAMEADRLVKMCSDIQLALQRHDLGRVKIALNEMMKLVDQLKRESTTSLSEFTTKTLPVINL